MSLTGDVLGQIGAEVSLNGGVGGSIEFTGEGTDNYNELDNKPSINGVVLTGNKTTADLHIDTGGTDDYLDLNNKPKINSVTLRGDVSSASLQISYNDLTDRPVIPDLTDLENRMDAVEGDIQSIETDIGDIGDRLIDIASDIATIQATDLVQNSDISSLKNRMNAAETSITNLGSRLTTAEGTISTHTSDISDLQGDVTSLDTIVGNGQQTVGSNLTDAVTQLNSSLTDLTTYSETSEKVIGEWVNGKPLYRLVISGTTHATAGTIKALKTFSDYEDLEIKNIYGTIKGSSSDNKYPYLPCNYYESSSSYSYTFMRGSDSSLSVKTTITSRPIEIVIEYTRVSD